ncbi:hypothetical protein B9T33_00585 [Acinetobacter sp. ANC 5054]|uniref:hypothetical protein n=1 Tax=Acinetobacter sp. ANC 5054 TaxID=1977877 RepID=UPI000A341BCC|nr:hypothetical protein [Acinetobacter sp. ANC 5054]OTG84327.1 hypothetical protein B9T33_00585 [Acinetobacter sp. ANC 5054]
MRIIFGLILGICLSIAALIGLQRFPQLLETYPQLAQLFPQQYNASTYNHDAEGKLLQTVEMLEDEEYKSIEGNEATLYQLDGQCKINLYIFGESYQLLTSFYFHHDRILRAYETYSTYPNGGYYAEPDTKDPFKLEKSYLRIMMPNNIKTQLELYQLEKHFNAKWWKNC